VWYIEGSQQLGLGNSNYNMQLQGPCNCYWLLTGLERYTLRAADSQCRMSVHFRMQVPIESCMLKVIAILCAQWVCENNLEAVSSKISEQNHKLLSLMCIY